MTETKNRICLGVETDKKNPHHRGRIIQIASGGLDGPVVVQVTTANFGKGTPGYNIEVALPTLENVHGLRWPNAYSGKKWVAYATWPMVDQPTEAGLTVALARRISTATIRFTDSVKNGTDTDQGEAELVALLREAGVQF